MLLCLQETRFQIWLPASVVTQVRAGVCANFGRSRQRFQKTPAGTGVVWGERSVPERRAPTSLPLLHLVGQKAALHGRLPHRGPQLACQPRPARHSLRIVAAAPSPWPIDPAARPVVVAGGEGFPLARYRPVSESAPPPRGNAAPGAGRRLACSFPVRPDAIVEASALSGNCDKSARWPKCVPLHHVREISMRRSYQPNVYLVSPRAAQALELLFLQDSQ